MEESDGRLTIGAVTWRTMSDGIALYKPDAFFSDVPPPLFDEALGPVLDEKGFLPVPYRPMVISAGNEVLLVDAGTGPEIAEEWGDPVGNLSATLAAAGIEPSSISMVVISHAHPDHVGGLTTVRDGAVVPSFPRARHLISRIEYESWTSKSVPESFAGMAKVARARLGPLADAGLLVPFDGEPEVAPGVSVIAAPGHTPGHMALKVSSGADHALWVADAVLGELAFDHVEWSSRLEVDRDAAVATRRSLLDRAAEEGGVFDGYHLGRPGSWNASARGSASPPSPEKALVLGGSAGEPQVPDPRRESESGVQPRDLGDVQPPDWRVVERALVQGEEVVAARDRNGRQSFGRADGNLRPDSPHSPGYRSYGDPRPHRDAAGAAHDERGPAAGGPEVGPVVLAALHVRSASSPRQAA